MCGFAGIINGDSIQTRASLGRMAAKVSFRGPDNCGIALYNDALQPAEEGRHALFFNRLAIMDIDPRSNQPFEDEHFLLTFNGEIYNFKDLKQTLESAGFSFHTSSDTEVLFNALKHWGTDAIEKLNGMFSFCWIDKIKRQFIISRDRLGIKPLYYRIKGDALFFASEIHSILRLSREVPPISKQAAEMYLWMQSVPTPYSIFEGIFKLPPGSFLQGSLESLKNGLEPRYYWDAYDFLQHAATSDEQELESVLKNSLQRQLQADVPLGLFLSSGVDSSLIAAMMNKHFSSDRDVNFFTITFDEETSSDESRDAENFIRGFHNPRLHTETMLVSSANLQRDLSSLYDYYDEPFADPAALLNWAISRKARERVTVAISGDGADELFWGYSRYSRWKKFTRNSHIPAISSLMRLFTSALPASSFSNNMRFALEKDPVMRHFNFFLPSGMRFMIRNHIAKQPIWAMKNVSAISSRADLPAVLDIKTYLADAMLYKVDRASMAASLEVRVPYLDNEMLEYALRLPLSIKSGKDITEKRPLKQLLIQLAPHYNLAKKKKGFGFPLNKWLKEKWKDQVMETMNNSDLSAAGLNPKPYLRIIDQYYHGGASHFTDVWFIFNLMLWMESIKKISRDIPE